MAASAARRYQSPAPRPIGRPSKLTPALQRRILGDIRNGMSLRDAAAAAGISTSTLTLWRQKGLDGERAYSDFAARSERAVQEGQQRLIRIVARGSKDDPRLALEVLSRRFPGWQAKQKLEVSTPPAGPVTWDLTLLDDDELAFVEAKLLKARRQLTAGTETQVTIDVPVVPAKGEEP
jgi:hypothetical protein